MTSSPSKYRDVAMGIAQRSGIPYPEMYGAFTDSIEAALIAAHDDGVEESAAVTHQMARALIGSRRTNQVNRHTSDVLCKARDTIGKLKLGTKP